MAERLPAISMGRLHLKNKLGRMESAMKKILSLLLALSMCLALAACWNSENSETAGNASQTVSGEDYSLETEGTETPEETQRKAMTHSKRCQDEFSLFSPLLIPFSFQRSDSRYS